jgi:hypothetical protein
MSGFSAGLTARSTAEQGSELARLCRNAQQSGARAGQKIDEEVDVAVRAHLAADG